MAVITKEQVEFLLEEGVKVRMENETLKRQVTLLTAERDAAYDRGFDEGHAAARAALEMKSILKR